MKLIQIAFLTGLMLITITALGAKKQKVLICHVGSDVGAADEVYLDDPDCVPGDTNDVGNKAHAFDGFADYEPSLVGASGVGTEDSNGDGIDDGCEPVETCPCWDQIELMSVSNENNYNAASCENGSILPHQALIQNNEAPNPDVEGSFVAVTFGTSAYCQTNAPESGLLITADEGNACIAQIATRCAAIGHPITP